MKPLTPVVAALLAAPFFTAPVAAHDYSAGTLTIQHPHALETPPMAATAGGYMTIGNAGDAPDRLLAVEAPPLRAEIHQSVEENGMHRMLPVEALEIPAHGSVELAPGGYHVMFMDLDGRQLLAGEHLPATLVFESAGRVAVEFAVQKRDAAAGSDHGMDHDTMDHGAADHGEPGHGEAGDSAD